METKTQLLDEKQQRIALELARGSIGEFLENGAEIDYPREDFLLQPAGAFVTLKLQGMLRGCIGYIEARFPLGETLVKCAISAAVHDPRFPPLRKEELQKVHLEISVLSSLWQIKDPQEIEVGKHGIVVSRGHYRGLLLPQVAVEYGWDRMTFLEQTCRKAGLPSGAWQDPEAAIELFWAQVFGEPE